MADATDQVPVINIGRSQKLYHKDQETDDSWQPSIGAAIKLLLSIRISGALWSILSDSDETFNHWEPLHAMLYLNDSVISLNSMPSVNYLAFIPGWFYLNALDQSKIAVFTLIRLTIGVTCLCGEYYAFDAISRRINISTGRYFLVFSMFSSGMFHAAVTFSPYTVSMICSFFFIGALLDGKRWLCCALWIISFSIGSLLTFVFFGITLFAFLVWYCTLHKIWIGNYLASVSASCITIFLYGAFFEYLPQFLRTIFPIDLAYESLSAAQFGFRPPGLTLHIVQHFVCNWNVAAVFAFVGPFLSYKACVNCQNHKENWKKLNDCSPIIFLALNTGYWLTMFFFLRRQESFVFPMYPNIALFAALACDAIPRLCYKEDASTDIANRSRRQITDPFIQRPRNKGHIFVYSFVSLFILCSLIRIYTVLQSYGSEIDIYKGFHEELDSHEEFDRFNNPIKLCLTKASERFPSSFFLPSEVYDGKTNSRKVEIHHIETDHSDIHSQLYSEKNQSISSNTVLDANLESCDYVIDIDEPSTETDPDFRVLSKQWKSIISLPYLDENRTNIPFRLFSIPFFSSYYDLTHKTTISLYRHIV